MYIRKRIFVGNETVVTSSHTTAEIDTLWRSQDSVNRWKENRLTTEAAITHLLLR